MKNLGANVLERISGGVAMGGSGTLVTTEYVHVDEFGLVDILTVVEEGSGLAVTVYVTGEVFLETVN